MVFDEIQSKIWGLSSSAGTSQFTFLHFQIDEKIKSNFPPGYLDGYTQGVAFFLWENYSVADYVDYLALSKQFLMIGDEQERDNFLIIQASKMTEDKESFLQWQHSQIYIALGFALSVVKERILSYKEVEGNLIDRFEQSLKIKNGVLKEIILF